MEHFVRPPIEVICYTAGLLDGEGTIFKVIADNRFGFSISQSAKNNGENLCHWLKEQWGGIGNIHGQTRYWKGRAQIQWQWQINAAYEVQHGLRHMLPYLRVKRDGAERALAYIQQRLDDGTRYLWTPGENDYLREHWRESDHVIAQVINRTPTAIRHQRRVLGIAGDSGFRYIRYWSDTDEQYIRDNWQQLDDEALGAALGRTAKSIRHRRHDLGLLRK